MFFFFQVASKCVRIMLTLRFQHVQYLWCVQTAFILNVASSLVYDNYIHKSRKILPVACYAFCSHL